MGMGLGLFYNDEITVLKYENNLAVTIFYKGLKAFTVSADHVIEAGKQDAEGDELRGWITSNFKDEIYDAIEDADAEAFEANKQEPQEKPFDASRLGYILRDIDSGEEFRIIQGTNNNYRAVSIRTHRLSLAVGNTIAELVEDLDEVEGMNFYMEVK